MATPSEVYLRLSPNLIDFDFGHLIPLNLNLLASDRNIKSNVTKVSSHSPKKTQKSWTGV